MSDQVKDPSTIRAVNRNLREEVAGKHLKKAVLKEDLAYASTPLKVDRDRNIIHDVKILGWSSKNKNRRYRAQGVDPKLYEGAFVNIDHPDGEEASRGPRPLSARFGEVRGIYKTTEGLFAKELHYVPTHPLCESILYMAEHKPNLFGCSQNAFGDVYEDATGEIVETVTDVRSIDLVSEPATTKGLFEGVEDEDPAAADAPPPPADPSMDADEGDIPLGGPADAAPPVDASADPAADPAADPSADPTAGMPDLDQDAAATPNTSGGIDITDETMSQVQKIFDSQLELKEKKRKLLQLLNHHHNMVQEAVVRQNLTKIKTVADAKRFLLEARDPATRRAGRAVVGTLDNYEVAEKLKTKRELAEGLCLKAKLPKDAVTPFFMKVLCECRDQKEMMEAIEDRRLITGTSSSRRPRSAGNTPLEEGVGYKDPAQMTTDERKKMDDAFLADVFRDREAARR